MTTLGYALLDGLPFGLVAAALGFAVAAASPLSPLLVGPVVGLATYAGAVALSLAVGDADSRFPLLGEAAGELFPL